MIRRYLNSDYNDVISLIKENGLEPISLEELQSFALVYERDEKIVGFIWGLTSEECATVFIDYFIVSKNYRNEKDQFGRGQVAVQLITSFLVFMFEFGKTRVIGQLPADSLSESLARIYNAVGMKFYDPYKFVQGNILEILTRMKEGQHGI